MILYTDAEVSFLLFVARVRVEVVRCAAVEFVTLAQFTAYKKAERDCTKPGGDPADCLEQG